jgi:hypothetical protein
MRFRHALTLFPFRDHPYHLVFLPSKSSDLLVRESDSSKGSKFAGSPEARVGGQEGGSEAAAGFHVNSAEAATVTSWERESRAILIGQTPANQILLDVSQIGALKQVGPAMFFSNPVVSEKSICTDLQGIADGAVRR